MRARTFEVSITWATLPGRQRRGGLADLLRGTAQFTVSARSDLEDDDSIAAYVLTVFGLDREECSVLAVNENPAPPRGVSAVVTISKLCPRCEWKGSGPADTAPYRKSDPCPACGLPAEED